MKQDKIQRLRNLLEKQHIDAVLISSKSNVFYISGFQGLSSQEREAYCFITKKNGFFITNPLYEHDIKPNGLILRITSPTERLTTILDEIVKKENIKVIGFEDTDISVAEFKTLKRIKSKFTSFSPNKIRISKSYEEITKIKKACEIGDKVFAGIVKKIKPGISEIEIAKEMEIEMLKNGCIPSFPTIVAFGKNAATPHHTAGNDKLSNNQFVLLDFGVIFEGYCSDMTRTVFVGSPEEKEKEVYESVRIAQNKAAEFIKKTLEKEVKNSLITVDAYKADKEARDYIISKKFPDFPHSLGHGTGIDVHESPSLYPHSKDKLSEGMVFSIEPGIYIKNRFGIRIEDLFAIQNNSLVKLTQSPVDLIIL